ncbi:MalY/PatB family protein [Halocynthiibacter sp.]|uniref:MalY/PatB family protein n=1 Tax=Halocynthiibacter sp. TaxID=1979210 RepID=UPI003C4EB410
MNFDEIIDRRNTHSAKWDAMEPVYGVPRDEGIAMWVADMDFRPPQSVQDALETMKDQGVYGYYADEKSYKDSICWWMETRHNWTVDPAAIFTTHGLVNGTSMCVDSFTKPGDGVVLFTPVYHAFARVIEASDRQVVECPLVVESGKYKLDFAAYDAQMTGNETMLVFCSPHNPGGRVWSRDELQGVIDFAKRHDLILVSDEIHHDLVFPGATHIPMANVDDSVVDRLVMMTATTKTFNIAGSHSGNVIIHDPDLRARFQKRMNAMGISPNSFGIYMAEAAYSETGAAWLEALIAYLDENRRILDEGLNSIPGVKSMPMEATYLSWADFSGTGMNSDEFIKRVQEDAKIAANHGITFGKGGEQYLRFNFATPRANIIEAVSRLKDAFSDMQ